MPRLPPLVSEVAARLRRPAPEPPSPSTAAATRWLARPTKSLQVSSHSASQQQIRGQQPSTSPEVRGPRRRQFLGAGPVEELLLLCPSQPQLVESSPSQQAGPVTQPPPRHLPSGRQPSVSLLTNSSRQDCLDLLPSRHLDSPTRLCPHNLKPTRSDLSDHLVEVRFT